MTIGFWQILILVLIIFLLFGASRLPNAARSLGRSMRIFKSEMDEMKKESKPAEQPAVEAPQANEIQDLAQPNTNPVQQPEGGNRS